MQHVILMDTDRINDNNIMHVAWGMMHMHDIVHAIITACIAYCIRSLDLVPNPSYAKGRKGVP